MANFELKFFDAEGESIIETNVNGKEVLISVTDTINNYKTIISLDISTAIKFAKTLRTEINKAKEVDNG